MKKLFGFIWNFCEYWNIDLGKLAPYVLGMAIGRRPRRVKKGGNGDVDKSKGKAL